VYTQYIIEEKSLLSDGAANDRIVFPRPIIELIRKSIKERRVRNEKLKRRSEWVSKK